MKTLSQATGNNKKSVPRRYHSSAEANRNYQEERQLVV